MNLQEQLSAALNKLKAIFVVFLKKVQVQPPVPIILPNVPVPAPIPTPTVSQIPNFVAGLFDAEGNGKQLGVKYNNWGDLKFTEYVKSLGATGAGENNFAVFPTKSIGDAACEKLVSDACHGLLLDYRPTMTISMFCIVYAQPPNLQHYVSIVLSHLTKVGLNANSPISQLL